jgi:hypothetical protein
MNLNNVRGIIPMASIARVMSPEEQKKFKKLWRLEQNGLQHTLTYQHLLGELRASGALIKPLVPINKKRVKPSKVFVDTAVVGEDKTVFMQVSLVNYGNRKLEDLSPDEQATLLNPPIPVHDEVVTAVAMSGKSDLAAELAAVMAEPSDETKKAVLINGFAPTT